LIKDIQQFRMAQATHLYATTPLLVQILLLMFTSTLATIGNLNMTLSSGSSMRLFKILTQPALLWMIPTIGLNNSLDLKELSI
jgi:hypothetical protein